MKNIIKIAAIVAVIGISLVGGGKIALGQNYFEGIDNPFVYMRDGQTYYQGEEHFLKSVNYLISIIWDADDNIVVAPYSNYASYTTPYNLRMPETQDIANNYFRAHFKMISDMGLNSIRVMNAAVEPRWDNQNELALTMLLRNPDDLEYENRVIQKDDCEHKPYFQYENINENGLEYYKYAMQTVLDIAEGYNLKVIWVTGGESRYLSCASHSDPEIRYHSLFNHINTVITDEYSDFLTSITNHFKYNPALFTYDLCNEPESFANEDLPNGLPVNKISLSDCVDKYHESVKTHSPNHYTTTGIFGERTFFKQGVKPFSDLDYVSFHIYNHTPYLHEDLAIADPVKRYLNYFNKTVLCDWVIGENGSQTKPNENAGETFEGTILKARTESKQRAEAEEIMNYSAACGAFCYTYWQFGNARDWQNFGLIKSDTAPLQIVVNEQTIETYPIYSDYKEIVYPYQNSIFNTFPTYAGGCDFDNELYMDIFNSDEEDYEWDGYVVDQGGNFIADAIVRIEVMYEDTATGVTKLSGFYTFTDEFGYFSLGIDNTTDNSANISAAKYGYQMTILKSIDKDDDVIIEIEKVEYPIREDYKFDYIVNQGTSGAITKPTMITGNVIVNSDATLTITCPIFFDDESRVIVYPGGRLILVDSAALTAIHDQWQGIEISGDPNNPAEMHTSGDNTIANAVMGITANNDVIIDINDTKFVNNRNDFLATHNEHQIKINNASFITTEQAYEGITSYYTHFSDCEDVRIANSHFCDNRTWEPNPVNKEGVYGTYSNILITTTHHDNRTSFNGLECAIDVHHGAIDVKHVDFTDNMHDINISEIKGNTIIDGCTFVVNNDWPIDEGEYNFFVQLRICENVIVTDCKFIDNSQLAIVSPMKFGIKAFDVGNLEVKPDNLVSTNITIFNNLKYGVYAISGPVGNNKILVKDSDFKTSRGIYLWNYSGFAPATIINNNFTVKDYSNLFLPDFGKGPWTGDIPPPDPIIDLEQDEIRPYGIYIDGYSTYYQVEGNNIISENGIHDNRYGIINRNNGPTTNRVYRNYFNKLENPVQAIGKNRNFESEYSGTESIDVVGLEIICNNFDSNKTDIYVTTETAHNGWGIAGKQGSNSQPAGNLFSRWTECNDIVINNEMTEFNYYTRNPFIDSNYDPRETPGNVGDPDALTVHVAPIDQPFTGNWCPDETIESTTENISDLHLHIVMSQLLEESIDQMLDDIVDGGNTEQVLSDIIHLEDDEAWITYYELMNSSPYLSDTVLEDIAKKEDVLTVPMIRDILVANPQSAKKSDVKKLLKDRNIQLPDYMIEQIEAGEMIISSKEVLEIQKFEQRKVYEENLFKLCDYYSVNPDSLSFAGDSIVSLLNRRIEPKYLYLLADYYVSTGDFLAAENTFKRINEECQISDFERDQVYDLIEFNNVYNYILSNQKLSVLALDAYSYEALLGLSKKDGIAGDKARKILYVNKYIYHLETIHKPLEYITPRSAKFEIGVNSSNPSFALYPNPADNYLTVDYKLVEKKGNVSVVITDVVGKLIYSKTFTSIEDIVLIDLKDIPPGTYICSLFNGNDCDFSEKFVKNK